MDFYLFKSINFWAGKYLWLDTLAIFFAEYFEYVLIFCLFLFLIKNPAPEQSSVLDQSRTETKFLVRGFRKYWLMVFQSLLAAILARLVIVNIIRQFLPRARPFVENQVNLLLTPELTNSFPSGHAAFYFAISTVVYFYNKKTGVLFFIASSLISLSRVFSAIHWPSDILAGAIIGIFSGWLIMFLFRKFFSAEKTKSLQ